MKRILSILFCFILLLSLALPCFATDVDLEFTCSYYHIPPTDISSSVNQWTYIPGTVSTDSFPGGTIGYFRGYTGFTNGYVYTITTTARYSGSSVPGYTEDLSHKLLPRIYAIENTLIGRNIDYSGSDQGVWDVSSTTFSEYENIKIHTYSYNNNRDITTSYVFQVDNPIFFDTYDLGFGFNWAPFQLPSNTTITYTRFTITADEAVNDSVFYQKNLEALEGIQDSVAAAGTDIVNSVDEMGNQISGSIDDLKAQAAADSAQAHRDAQEAKDQAHQDAENAPQHEKDFIEDNKGNTDDISIPDLPVDDAKSFISDLYNTISTTSTQSYLNLPTVTIPFLNKPLWTNQRLDFGTWLSNSFISSLLSWIKGVFSIIAIYAIIHNVYSLVLIALGRNSDSGGSSDE